MMNASAPMMGKILAFSRNVDFMIRLYYGIATFISRYGVIPPRKASKSAARLSDAQMFQAGYTLFISKVQTMKRVFQLFLMIYVFLYRLSGGRFGSQVQGLQVLLLTSSGRKTNRKRTTPLGYFMDGDRYIIIASNAGFDSHPAWFYNLSKNPQVLIEVGRQKLQVEANIVEPGKRDLLWAKLVKLAPGYAGYERKTSRVIPLMALQPLTSQ